MLARPRPADIKTDLETPRGTILPEGIAIVKDEYNSSFDATHYTIVNDHPYGAI
ncbi:MAG: hypothetical protein GY820_46885 [Gammaproteobacteria bacterium]|nr:hypothetical protein [Gammaproteobacteria bacterium]